MRKMYDVHKKRKEIVIYIVGVFFRYRAPIHWLFRDYTTFNNETVCRQRP